MNVSSNVHRVSRLEINDVELEDARFGKYHAAHLTFLGPNNEVIYEISVFPENHDALALVFEGVALQKKVMP